MPLSILSCRTLFRLPCLMIFCAREEALLLMALRLMLTIDLPCEVSILSFDSSVINFENSQILYLESEFDKEVNEQMQKFYREICSEVRLAGFELVYLPKVSEHYSSIAEADLLRIVKCLYPKVSTERLQSVITQMLNLSTASFCNNQLSPKFSIKELRSISPSFLIKIGDSTVNDKKNIEFSACGNRKKIHWLQSGLYLTFLLSITIICV